MSNSSTSAALSRDYDDDDPEAVGTSQPMPIPADQLQFDEPRQTIGKGGFGIVERAIFNPPNSRSVVVVVKRIPGRSVSFNRLKKRTGREILIWSKLSHANIIPFLGYEWNEAAEEVWLVCPWLAKGTIHDYLNSSLAGIEQRMKLIVNTAEALNYLHSLSPPICHGDIKGANVLVTETEDAMLTDFGLSRMLDDSLVNLETTHQFQGSIPWCSPELFEADECVRSPESDVWAWAWLVSESKDYSHEEPNFGLKKLPQNYVAPELAIAATSSNKAHHLEEGGHRPLNWQLVDQEEAVGAEVVPEFATQREALGAQAPDHKHQAPMELFTAVKQIANGLECLHSNNIVHGDLRVHTFIVNAAGTVQVSGFDLVELLGVAPEDLFTIRVSPLELLQGSPPTTATDVYAFANVALEVFTGSQPFIKHQRDATVLSTLHSGGHSKAESYPDFPHKAAVWKLFRKCWNSDPTKRPVMSRVIEM
ncbi:hypothetical protein FRC00_007925, partial [Tulasnella sp. 408]